MIDIIIALFNLCFRPRFGYQLPMIGSQWFDTKESCSEQTVYTVLSAYHGDASSPVCLTNREKELYKEVDIIEFSNNWRCIGFDKEIYENALKQGYKG